MNLGIVHHFDLDWLPFLQPSGRETIRFCAARSCETQLCGAFESRVYEPNEVRGVLVSLCFSNSDFERLLLTFELTHFNVKVILYASG